MRITVIQTEKKYDNILSWDSKEDFQKFIQSIEKVQRAADNWPVEPLELHVAHLDVSWNKQTGPRTVEELSTTEPVKVEEPDPNTSTTTV